MIEKRVRNIALAATKTTLYDLADWLMGWQDEGDLAGKIPNFSERKKLGALVREYAEMRDDIGSPGLEPDPSRDDGPVEKVPSTLASISSHADSIAVEFSADMISGTLASATLEDPAFKLMFEQQFGNDEPYFEEGSEIYRDEETGEIRARFIVSGASTP